MGVGVQQQLLAAIDKWVLQDQDAPELHVELADDLAQAGLLAQADAELAALAARQGPQALHPLLRAAVDAARADLLWRQGQLAQAEATWRRLLGLPLAEGMLRTLEVKLHFARLPQAREALTQLWLTGAQPVPGGADAVLERLAQALPADPLAQSQWARRLLAMDSARGLHILNEVLPQLLANSPYTARETARQVLWRHAVDAAAKDVPLLTRLVAESAVPPSLVAEWRRREQRLTEIRAN